MFKFRMLTSVVDTVTGFDGIIICRAEYSHGAPNQYLLTNMDTTGRPVEWWALEDRLTKSCDFDEG